MAHKAQQLALCERLGWQVVPGHQGNYFVAGLPLAELAARDARRARELAGAAYELGLAFALGAPVVVVTDAGDRLPFDVDVSPIEMEGGTTFHFVTDGIHVALQRAKSSAQGKDVRVGGGVATVRQYLGAGLIDEMHLVVSPILLGKGEHLMSGLDLAGLGFKVAQTAATQKATHYILTKA